MHRTPDCVASESPAGVRPESWGYQATTKKKKQEIKKKNNQRSNSRNERGERKEMKLQRKVKNKKEFS